MRIQRIIPFILIALLYAGCQKDADISFLDSDIALISTEAPPSEADVLAAQKQLNSLLSDKRLVSKLDATPAEMARMAQSLGTRSLSEKYLRLVQNPDFTLYRDLVKRAINPNDYECSSASIFDAYFDKITKDWTEQDGQIFNTFGGLAFAKSYFLDNSENRESFGPRGEFTRAVTSTFRDLRYFWEMRNNILLLDSHGTAYKDVAAITQLIEMLIPFPDEKGKPGPFPHDKAVQTAGLLKTFFGSAKFQNYNHPLFTFNALAETDIPELGIVKKIVMGDGVLKGYADLGYGDIAPQFVLAHEYGHQIQIANDYIDNESYNTDVEYSRKVEIMADGYAGYYISHKQGYNYHGKLQHLLDLPYSVGDCQFDTPGHHGTANQRVKATIFGIKLATATESESHGHGHEHDCNRVLTGYQFIGLFEKALPSIVAPDAKLINPDLILASN